MLEFILIFSVLFLILTFFYKQAICEFRINQIEWSQKDEISSLLSEKIPLVVRSIPTTTVWSFNDVINRPCFDNIPIFNEIGLKEWIIQSEVSVNCPWKYKQAEQIASISGISIWADQWIRPQLIHPFLSFWMIPKYHSWAGQFGLHKTFATWTCIIPIDTDIIVTILSENMEAFLPTSWKNTFPSQLTNKDTPFIKDIKFIDIIVRPGTCLIMPPHWFISWTSTDDSTQLPMVCTISYHTPISLLAFNLSPHNK
jgi:hypothetical protein